MTADGRTAGVGLRIAFVYGAFFLFLGMFAPYWPVWLKSLGLDPSVIGILVALTYALKVVSSPIIAQISDRSGHRRRILAVVAGLAALLFGLYFGAQGFLALALVTAVSHVFIPPILSLTEQFAVRAVRGHGIHYGRVRAAGSVAFVAAASGGGLAVGQWGVGVVMPFCLAALVATFISILVLPEGQENRSTAPASLGLEPVMELFRIPGFFRILTVVALLQASHGAYYAFSTVHWQSEGLDTALIGALWAVAVIAEILLFVFAGRGLAALNPGRVLLAVGLAGTVRWTVTALTSELALLFPVQCLHALTYGVTHLAMMRFLASAVPAHRAATAQALYSAGPMGIALGVVLAGSGVLYDAAGGLVFLAMAVMCALAAVVSLRLARRDALQTP